ncbi:MAG: hypothetical protein AAB899_00760 [Patescibacteria group bacterium]
MADKPVAEKSGMFSNILAVAGLVILIAIIVWGAANLASLSGSWLSSLSSAFSFSSKSIKVTVPSKKLPSGEQFSVSWKYNPEGAGTYALLYQCKEGFQFKTAVAGNAPVAIPCGIGYTMLAEDNKFNVIPFLSGTSSLDVPLSIIFMPSAAAATGTPSRIQGSASVTIVSASAEPAETTLELQAQPQTNELPAPAGAEAGGQSGIPASANATGSADLSVRILSKGVIDPISGDIIPRSPTSANDLVAARFLISNDGSATTGPWYFGALLPTSPAYPYTSPAQMPLKAGGSIENMLRFKNAVPGGIFSVTIDPVNEVRESNEGNNSASTSI